MLISLGGVEADFVAPLRHHLADDADAGVVVVVRHETPERRAPEATCGRHARGEVRRVGPDRLDGVAADEVHAGHGAVEVLRERESRRSLVLVDALLEPGEHLVAGVHHEALPHQARRIREPLWKESARQVSEKPGCLDGVAGDDHVACSLPTQRAAVAAEVEHARHESPDVVLDPYHHGVGSHFRACADGATIVRDEHRALRVGGASVVAEAAIDAGWTVAVRRAEHRHGSRRDRNAERGAPFTRTRADALSSCSRCGYRLRRHPPGWKVGASASFAPSAAPDAPARNRLPAGRRRRSQR